MKKRSDGMGLGTKGGGKEGWIWSRYLMHTYGNS